MDHLTSVVNISLPKGNGLTKGGLKESDELITARSKLFVIDFAKK